LVWCDEAANRGQMDAAEYAQFDGLGLAALVRAGEVSATELAKAAIARAGEVDPTLNAIVHEHFDQARRRAADAPTGPFGGVPFLIKDLRQDLAGEPAGGGNRALRDAGHRATTTSVLVERWLAAGVVIIGRTATPEFGAKPVTEPDAGGPTRNPWDPSRSPGGSSGGSAAAVAAGIVPLAGASDGGGSIRIPASHCGLFGLKPGRGRTPSGPAAGEAFHGGAMSHVLTRTVRDSAAMLDVTHGPEAASLARLAPPERPYLDEVGRDPGRLRIAFTTRSPIDTEVDPEAVAAVDAAARLLESLGHDVTEGEPDIDSAGLADDFMVLWYAHIARAVDEVRALTGCGDDGFEPDTLAMAAAGRAIRADRYVAAYEHAVGATAALARFHERHDLYLTPTVAFPPPRIGELATPAWQTGAVKALSRLRLLGVLAHTGTMARTVRDNLRWTPFTQLANLAGVPAMSVPLHRSAGGLPVGVQFVGPVDSEGLLFRLAGQLEAAQPWPGPVLGPITSPV
jgi:amidase